MRPLFFLITLILFLLPLSGWSGEWEGKLRISEYHPTHKFRKIYGNWMSQYQIEGSRKILQDWKLWTNATWMQKKGHSEGLHNDTKLYLIPLSLGLKRSFCFNDQFQLYLGAGASYAFLHIRDHSSHVIKHSSKQGFGAVFKSGIYFPFANCFFFDLFADYLYQPFHFSKRHHSPRVERHSINAGGWSLGIGIGVRL